MSNHTEVCTRIMKRRLKNNKGNIFGIKGKSEYIINTN